ncbi:helix-turn-helix domain-containing protein [Ferviditalea candida]|uniref:Helix-turn-helix domain-containing protein n=1 Tax=Ferviditalea candida TaxID=3108399 RepID=A0ABU5ZET6_9BACL|nr:helix-turn-helix domain-containing protein [Paenibacillaceae bacterium T2]
MTEFYQLIIKAREGDQEAWMTIIDRFSPLIRKTRREARQQERDDLEQELKEKIISIILTYDVDNLPSFSDFCEHILSESEDRFTNPK